MAPLGMEFYEGDLFPAEYQNRIFIAEHGSWNRSQKIGYRITLVRLNGSSEVVSYETFADGWLQGQSNWGRPVDLEHLPEGSLLVSDDLERRDLSDQLLRELIALTGPVASFGSGQNRRLQSGKNRFHSKDATRRIRVCEIQAEAVRPPDA